MSLLNRINKRRRQRNITPYEPAGVMGMTQYAGSRWENSISSYITAMPQFADYFAYKATTREAVSWRV